MNEDAAASRVVQLTDTHFSAVAGVPEQWPATLRWLQEDPPDLVVHSGDIVVEDPDDEADRAFARVLLDDVPGPLHCIPGNHDVGMFGDPGGAAARDARVEVFRTIWGDDRFLVDLAGWRLVGADTYLLGSPDHDRWLHDATRTSSPVLVFVHQPLTGDPADGWELPAAARQAFEDAVAGADVRVVASGHRHASGRFGRAVWAPSLTVPGPFEIPGTDPRCGLVEHRLGRGGLHEHRVLRPWADGVGELSRAARRG